MEARLCLWSVIMTRNHFDGGMRLLQGLAALQPRIQGWLGRNVQVAGCIAGSGHSAIGIMTDDGKGCSRR